MKRYIEPKEAYAEIKAGNTINIEMIDGHGSFKETASAGVFRFSIYDKVAPTSVASVEFNAFKLRKILCKKENECKFYIEGDLNDKGHNESGRSFKGQSRTKDYFKRLSQYIKRYCK